MVNQIDNSFELAEDEEEQEFLRRQEENDSSSDVSEATAVAVPLIKSFAKDATFEHADITSRVITQGPRLQEQLELMIDSRHLSNDVYLPAYESGRMRKEIILTFIPWVPEDTPTMGNLIASRSGCPVVNLEYSPNEYGYEFYFDALTVANFERLGWKFVIFMPSMIGDDFKDNTWLWATQLRNQLEEAGAEGIKVLPFKSLDPRRELIPNSFALGGSEIDSIFNCELHLHGELWTGPTEVGRSVASELEQLPDGLGFAIDITPIPWDDFKFMRAEQMVMKSRVFPGKHSLGVPAVSREAAMITDYKVPASVKLKATVAPHGLRKTQNAKTDFLQRVVDWGGCAITITPLRSVNKSIEENFGGQTRGELLDNRTMQSLEKVTDEFLLGTPKQRHGILCIESLTHKSKIGLKLTRIKEAWHALNEKLNREQLQAWEQAQAQLKPADRKPKSKPKHKALAPSIDIIIDEVPIVINRILEGATVRNPGLTIDVFTELMTFAVSTGGRVNIMSADLSRKEHGLFSSLLGLSEFDWLNENTVSCINAGIRTALPNKRHIFLSNHLEATKKRIYSSVNTAVENKQVVFIASNKVKPSSTATSTIAEQIKVNCGDHVRVLELNAKTVVNRKHPAYAFMNSDEHQQMLLLQTIDVVVATSVVEAGVSWDSRLFDDVPDNLVLSIFCIDVDGRWSSSGILQAVNRWRNHDVPAEICTTDRRMCKKQYVFDNDFQPPVIKEGMIKDRDAFAMMLMGIFGERKLEGNAWLDALATKEAQEQLQLRNPLAAVSAVAKSMGHTVAMIDDSSFNVAEKQAAQKQAKLITSRFRHIRNAIAARAISLEGAQRIQDCVTTLVYERMRTTAALSPDADVKLLLQSGVDELLERNIQLAKKGKQPTTVAGRAKQQRRIDAFDYLEPGHRLTLLAFLLLQQTGLDAAAVAIASVDSPEAQMVREMSSMFIADVQAGVETLLPVLGRKALQELGRQQTKTDETQMLLERLAVMDEFELNEELTGDGVEMEAFEWMDLTHTQVPKVLRKRFLIESDEATLKQICDAAVFDVPIDTSTGRILEVSRAVRGAHHGVSTRAFQLLTGFERTFGTEVVDRDYLRFVRSCMANSSWLTTTDIDSIGETWGSCARWIVGNIDRIDALSRGHIFLLSDGDEIEQLADCIHSNRKNLGGFIENAYGIIEKKDGSSNHLNYLRGVFNEASMYSLETLGPITVSSQRKTLVVLKRKGNVPSEAECQRLYKRWLDSLGKSIYLIETLATFEKGELEIQQAQAGQRSSGGTAVAPLKQMLKQLSPAMQLKLRGVSEQKLQQYLIDNPEYAGKRKLLRTRKQSAVHRRNNRRIF